MIIVFLVIMLVFAIYMFWHFDQKRRIRNAVHQREKREAFMDLLIQLRKRNKEPVEENKTK